MAEFIAFDWEKSELRGLDGVASKGRATVQRHFDLQWPTTDLEEPAEPRQTGEWLKEELKRLGVTARRALVSLPREEVVVRQLEVPDVLDEELPELVRLQAETKLSTSIDSLVLDFLPLPRIEGETSRAVLLFTFAVEKLKSIQHIIESAGLELAQVGISTSATAELVARIERSRELDADETALTVSRHGKRLEISLMRQRHLLFAHSTQLTGDDDQQDSRLALAEIRRSLGAHSRIDADVSINRVWAVGSERENELFCRTIAQQLACDVNVIDPLSNDLTTFSGRNQATSGEPSGSMESHASYGGPLGMLLAVDEPLVETIDFLNPRRTVVRPDRRKLKVGLVAAGIALTLAVTYVGTQWQASSLIEKTDEMNERLDRFAESIKRGRPTIAAAEVVNDWRQHSDDWLWRMADVNRALPGTDRLYLKNYRFSPATGDAAGHVSAIGFARSDRDVFDLYQRLSDRGYRVQPQAVLRTSKDKGYPYSFQMELDVAISQNGKTAAGDSRKR